MLRKNNLVVKMAEGKIENENRDLTSNPSHKDNPGSTGPSTMAADLRARGMDDSRIAQSKARHLAGFEDFKRSLWDDLPEMTSEVEVFSVKGEHGEQGEQGERVKTCGEGATEAKITFPNPYAADSSERKRTTLTQDWSHYQPLGQIVFFIAAHMT
jgi:hypothetical protein